MAVPKNETVQFPEAPKKPAMTMKLEFVTPGLASEYLERNFKRNRNKKGGWVERLTATITAGEFRTTHQGIAFDEGGKLVDGQNRLLAIVEAGKGVWLWVCRGVRHEDVAAVDRGVMRSIANQIRITTTLDVGHNHVAVTRAMLIGFTPGGRMELTDYQIAEAMAAHWDAISLVCRRGCRRGMTATIRGMVAKAYYHVDREVLERFLEVLYSGVPQGPQDTAASRLREYSLSFAKTAGASREMMARKSVSAIMAFSEGRPLSKLYLASENPYPLPE